MTTFFSFAGCVCENSSEWKEKYDLSDNEADDSVSFDMKNTFIFRPDLTLNASGLRGDELVTMPHLLIMVSGLT